MDYSFSDITSGQTDADSIINQVLMDSIRQDIYHLKEFGYGTTSPYTPIAKHNHDGSNSAAVSAIANDVITPAMMKDGALTLMNIMSEEETNSSLWTDTKHDVYAFFPVGATTLNLLTSLKTTQYGTAYSRFVIDAGVATSSQTSQTGYDNYYWTGGVATLDVSSYANGYHRVTVQILNTTSYTAYIRGSHMFWT